MHRSEVGASLPADRMRPRARSEVYEPMRGVRSRSRGLVAPAASSTAAVDDEEDDRNDDRQDDCGCDDPAGVTPIACFVWMVGAHLATSFRYLLFQYDTTLIAVLHVSS